MTETVPVRFRGPLGAVVDRIAKGDFEWLIHHGYARAGVDLGMWVRQYPAHVIPLPPEAWQLAECGRVAVEPGTWWVIVPLWTAEEGRSDLSLEATVHEQDERISIEINDIHVL